MSNAKTVMSQAANTWAGPTFIEDVFSTYLYTGNGSTQTITNGIDLAGEGGLVWLKARSEVQSHLLYDTERGATKSLSTNLTSAEGVVTGVSAFNADGFSLGSTVNSSGQTYASWTFRKALRFFDVVTYTGDGVAGRTVSHNLGVDPGCIIVKRIDGVDDWCVYNRGLNNGVNPEQYFVNLNLINAELARTNRWNDTAPTSTDFTVGTLETNVSGSTYVAYLFAHDPLGPSGDGSDGLIACGSYTGTGSNQSVDLGWEPQWVLWKASSAVDDWYVTDNMRGMGPQDINATTLRPSQSAAENASGRFGLTSTGFDFIGDSGVTYIYIAIRRGPMRQPTSGTEVFAIATPNSTNSPRYSAPFTVDGVFEHFRDGGSASRPRWAARLTGARYLSSSTTSAEASSTEWDFAFNEGYMTAVRNTTSWVSGMWRRAPGFFDVVAYTGDGVSGRTVSHNLGVAPEMMIVKRRDGGSWLVYHAGTAIDPETDYLILNATNGVADNATMWNDTAPSDTVFTLGSSASTNASGSPHIAYLFATLPGVSKVGSYTGNGTSQTIDCGFTSGARFILIKRTDSTGDWYVWDTERGIVAANDPHLSLNTTAAEVTTDDSVDPDSSGFIVNQVAATNINVNAATYIFYAIA